MKIHKIVAEQRRRLGLKQYQVAEQTGIAPSQISIFEQGKCGMVTTNLEKLLSALGLEVVFDRNVHQQEEAGKVAKELLTRGIEEMKFISREEVSQLVDNPDILLLPVVSEDLYHQYTKSKVVDETNTWNYFARLVQEAIYDQKHRQSQGR